MIGSKFLTGLRTGIRSSTVFPSQARSIHQHAMVSYVSKLAAKTAPHFGRLNLSNIIAYTPNLMFWSGASWAGLFAFTEGWPLFQDTFYKKLPLFGSHWVKTIDPEDSPQ